MKPCSPQVAGVGHLPQRTVQVKSTPSSTDWNPGQPHCLSLVTEVTVLAPTCQFPSKFVYYDRERKKKRRWKSKGNSLATHIDDQSTTLKIFSCVLQLPLTKSRPSSVLIVPKPGTQSHNTARIKPLFVYLFNWISSGSSTIF